MTRVVSWVVEKAAVLVAPLVDLTVVHLVETKVAVLVVSLVDVKVGMME